MAIVRSGAYEVVRLVPDRPGFVVNDKLPARTPLTDRSTVEIREMPRRFIFIDGKAVGQPLPEASTPLEANPPPR